MPTIDADGRVTAYEVDGAGPPLVLLHGATGSGGDHFAGLRPVLAEAFRCYMPDARGHGGTAWDANESWTTTDLVADLDAYVDAVGLTTFHLLGYSMGGMTALHYAARFPDRIRTLVAISIGPEREPRLAVGRALMDTETIERDDPGWAARLAARHDPAHGSGSWRRLLDAIVSDIAAQPLLTPRDLRAIDAPTLVVDGDRDPFVPIPRQRRWRARSRMVAFSCCPTSAMIHWASTCPSSRLRSPTSTDRPSPSRAPAPTSH